MVRRAATTACCITERLSHDIATELSWVIGPALIASLHGQGDPLDHREKLSFFLVQASLGDTRRVRGQGKTLTRAANLMGKGTVGTNE